MQPNNQVMQQQPVVMSPPNQMPMMPNQVVIVPNRFVMPNGRRYNNHLVMGLGITQLSLGTLVIFVSIIAMIRIDYYYVPVHLFAISGGIWVIVTGIMGIISSRKPYNGCLGGTYMGFNIVSSFLTFIGVVLSLLWFRYDIIGIIEGILLLFEFGVALTAAIIGWFYQCAANQTQGYVMQPTHQYMQFENSSNTTQGQPADNQGAPDVNQGLPYSGHSSPGFMNQQQHIPQNQQGYFTEQPPAYNNQPMGNQNMGYPGQPNENNLEENLHKTSCKE